MQKKWAFVSDLARLLIIYNNGGVYLDTDVELISSLDSVLDNSFFLGIETDTDIRHDKEFVSIATGLGFGAEVKNEIIKSMIDEYTDVHFIKDDGSYDLTPCPVRNSLALKRNGWDGKDNVCELAGGTIYSSDYFCPEEFNTDIKHYSKNTISIHHFDSSWKTNKEKMKDKLKLEVKKVLRKIVWGYKKRRYFTFYTTLFQFFYLNRAVHQRTYCDVHNYGCICFECL